MNEGRKSDVSRLGSKNSSTAVGKQLAEVTIPEPLMQRVFELDEEARSVRDRAEVIVIPRPSSTLLGDGQILKSPIHPGELSGCHGLHRIVEVCYEVQTRPQPTAYVAIKVLEQEVGSATLDESNSSWSFKVTFLGIQVEGAILLDLEKCRLTAFVTTALGGTKLRWAGTLIRWC